MNFLQQDRFWSIQLRILVGDKSDKFIIMQICQALYRYQEEVAVLCKCFICQWKDSFILAFLQLLESLLTGC